MTHAMATDKQDLKNTLQKVKLKVCVNVRQFCVQQLSLISTVACACMATPQRLA